jgi:uncharacterized protein (DUF779 family)
LRLGQVHEPPAYIYSIRYQAFHNIQLSIQSLGKGKYLY